MLDLLPIRIYSKYLLKEEDLASSIQNYLEDRFSVSYSDIKISYCLKMITFRNSILCNICLNYYKDVNNKLVIDISEHGYKLYITNHNEDEVFNNKYVTINCPNFESMIYAIVNEHKHYRPYIRRVIDKLFKVDRVDTNTLIETEYEKFRKDLAVEHSFFITKSNSRHIIADTFINGLDFSKLVMIDANTYVCYSVKDKTCYIINLRYKKDIANRNGYIYTIYTIYNILDNSDDKIFNYRELVENKFLSNISIDATTIDKINYLQNNILLDITPSKIYSKFT